MKKIKYLLVIILICIIVFIGIEIFRDKTHEDESNNVTVDIADIVEKDNNTTNNVNNIIDDDNTSNTIKQDTITEENNKPKVEKIKDGKELLEKAEKTITARGWARASNNIIGLKDEVLYYYNKGTGEFYQIAEGIEDIYFETEYAEDIIAKKGENFKKIHDKPVFLIYE